ncbi:MAG: DNA primase [Acidobacteria bacterium]|nr:MAG: DNA primase [Acidobacteriota bacterium]
MNEDIRQQIKDALPLSTIVSRYVPLKKKGNRLLARCPFHSEKTPSFSVNDQKGFYYCFGCKVGGDHFKFIQAVENLEFYEALEFLADLAGMELPKRGHFGPDRKTVEIYRQINEQAVEFYEKQLNQHQQARAYLEKRGIQASTRKLFRLGVAPSQWDLLYQTMKDRYPAEVLRQCGLFREKNGRHYDLFNRGRIIFPIFDVHGHAVAFGGRLVEGEGPKYINSPETPIYTKGKHVYNLNFARPFLKKGQDLVVVEGYMDVIQIYQAGIGAVVAPLGTAFTADQARLAKRYAKSVVLSFDGDRAGFSAARKTIDALLVQDLDTRVMSLPRGMDPDDFILEKGVEAYGKLVKDAVDFFDFLFSYFLQDSGGTEREMTPRQVSTLIRECVPSMSLIKDPVIKESYFRKLSERTGASLRSIRHILLEKKKPDKQPGKQGEAHFDHHRQEQVKPLALIEKELIRLLLRVSDFSMALNEQEQSLFDDYLKQFFEERRGVWAFLREEGEEKMDLLKEMPDSLSHELRELYLEDENAVGEDRELVDQIRSLYFDLTIWYLERQSQKLSEQRQRLPDSDFQKRAEFSANKAKIEKKIRVLREQVRRQKGRSYG